MHLILCKMNYVDRFIEFSWIETYIHKYVDRKPQLMLSIFHPSKCMHTDNRSDGTSNLYILYILLDLRCMYS